MKLFEDFILFEAFVELSLPMLRWNDNPKIGWWLDKDPVRFYHGTHIDNLKGIAETGLYAPKLCPTAGWVSLALEPNTAFGYASMGGESGFRAAGAKAKHIPRDKRVVFVIDLPQRYFLSKMAIIRGAIERDKMKLKDKELYLAHRGQDQEYYAMTEIRVPNKVELKYIKGWMKP